MVHQEESSDQDDRVYSCTGLQWVDQGRDRSDTRTQPLSHKLSDTRPRCWPGQHYLYLSKQNKQIKYLTISSLSV